MKTKSAVAIAVLGLVVALGGGMPSAIAQTNGARLAAAAPATMSCQEIDATAASLIKEVDFVLADRKQTKATLKDPAYYPSVLNKPHADDLLAALQLRARSQQCGDLRELKSLRIKANNFVTTFDWQNPGGKGPAKAVDMRVKAVVAAAQKARPGEYEKLVQCQHAYMQAAWGDHYLGQARTIPSLLNGSNGNVMLTLQDRAGRLNTDKAWNDDSLTVHHKPKLVTANIHQKVQACDTMLGANVLSKMPPAPTLVTKPQVELRTYSVAKVQTATCEGLQSFVQAWITEVQFVRSERIRNSDATIMSKQLNLSDATSLADALPKRASQLQCKISLPVPIDPIRAALDFAPGKLP